MIKKKKKSKNPAVVHFCSITNLTHCTVASGVLGGPNKGADNSLNWYLGPTTEPILTARPRPWRPVAYPGILSRGGGEGRVQQIEDRENGDLGAVPT